MAKAAEESKADEKKELIKKEEGKEQETKPKDSKEDWASINATDVDSSLASNQTSEALTEMSEERRKELLDEIAAVESTHFYWPYITLFMIVFVVLILTTLFWGSNGTPSPVGILNCSPGFWVLYAVFHLTGAICCGIGCFLLAKMNKKK